MSGVGRIHHLRPLRDVEADAVEAQLTSHLRPLTEVGETRPPLLAVEVTRGDSLCVIAPTGELDMSSSGTFEAAVLEAEASDAERITIDLSEVTFIDSSGLHVLLRAGARARADSNRLRLVRGGPYVQRVFQVTRTEEMLPFLD